MELILFIILLYILYNPTRQLKKKYDESSYRVFSKLSFKEMAFNKGNLGEFHTFYELEKLDRTNKLLANIHLLREDGTTTEIDLLMISTKGIFVFESKNYRGWIYGNETHRYWTQTFAKGTKNKFFNPIWQNKAHIQALADTLEIKDLNKFHSYIVFGEQTTLKSITSISPRVKVLTRNNLLAQLQKELHVSQNVFTPKQTDDFFRILLDKRARGSDVKTKHNQQVAELVANKQTSKIEAYQRSET